LYFKTLQIGRFPISTNDEWRESFIPQVFGENMAKIEMCLGALW